MSDAPARLNALASESSPYLRLHRHNPVDWYPWGEEALDRAVAEEKPIFLSVGYSTCYWCHVMERESFSSPEIAEAMNRHFINIKVDREERPDLDEIYMVATQVLTHQGGWPNSLFLTPQLAPFFAGTYFPPRDQGERPGFMNVIRSLADAWENRRDEVLEQGESVVGAIRHYLEDRDEPTDHLPGGEPAGRSLRALERQFDRQWGGFGMAPKFPSVPNLWLAESFIDDTASGDGALEMLETTLDRMARGGIYDQLGGGFHRYSTDAEWRVPHFEKMLYDNGLLLELYARRMERSPSAQSERVLRETTAFLDREMRAPQGAFWSAIDAETDGNEGAYYVWTQGELVELLGREDAAFLAPLFGFQGGPFFEGSRYVLHRPDAIERQAARRQVDPAELESEVRPLLDRLLVARDARERPATDDKILADWNGMAIAGLAEAGRVLGDERAVEMAAMAARFVLENLRSEDGVLLHTWREGEGNVEAFLADYAFLLRGLLALHRATGDGAWLESAVEVAEEMERRLGASEGGFYAAAESSDLVARSRDVYDGALPSANAVATLGLLALADRTGDPRWRESAERNLRVHGALIEDRPEAARTLALAARRAGGETGESDSVTVQATPQEVARHAPDDVLSARLVVDAPRAEATGAVEAGWSDFELELTIREGWHVYAHDSTTPTGPPTTLTARDAELEGVVFPNAQPGPKGGVRVHRGQLVIRGRLHIVGARPRLELSVQPCDDTRCLAPAVLELDLLDPVND